MAGVFGVGRGGEGYELDWEGETVIIKAVAAARRAADEITELMAETARTSHIWENRTGQTEAAIYQKPAVITWHGDQPRVRGEWGIEARGRFNEEGELEKVNTKDVGLVLQFGTSGAP